MAKTTCSVVICQSPRQYCQRIAEKKGMCGAHYQRKRTFGDVQAHIPLREPQEGDCKFPGCERPKDSRGWCCGHYQQELHGKPMTPLKLLPAHGDTCDFPKCDKPWKGYGHGEYAGLCVGHYQQERRGAPLTPLKVFAPKGTGHVNENGYRIIGIDGKHLAEHKVIMEKFIGREMFPDETVHHRNGIRSDNRLTNLELKPSRHGKGQSIPDLLEWAHELIDRYEGSNVEHLPYDESQSA